MELNFDDFLDQTNFNPPEDSSFGGILDSGGSALLTSGNPYAMAAGSVERLVSKIASLVGRGRQEADQIVPLQNQLNNDVFAPVSAEMENPSTSVERLQQLRTWLKQSMDAFLKFI